MKRFSFLLALLLLLTGCAGLPETPDAPMEFTGPAETVDLMPGASPETSALAFYTYDGKTGTRQHLFEQKAVERVLQAFHAAKAQPVSLNTARLRAPYFGLEIGGQDGFAVCGLWSEGYFITGSGKAYAFEYDFSELAERFSGEPADTFLDPAGLPCAEIAARTADGWNTGFLIRADEPAGEKGITMELVSASDQEVTVRYVNYKETEWAYGLYAELHALVDGVWYNLPIQSNYAVIDIARLVPAGKSAEESYSLQPWGDLFPGSYRLVSNGLSVDFSVD